MLKPLEDLFEAKEEFERCWPWLEAALSAFGIPTHTKHQVWWRIEKQRAFLWTRKKAAIIGEFYYFPSGIVSFNYWLQGGELKACKAMHKGIEEWAADREKLDFYTGFGRPGWAKEMHGNWQRGPTQRWKRASP